MNGRLPAEFLWGTATAAHQVEGDNVNSDCWVLEHAEPSIFAEPSLAACDHWHRFAEDITIVASLGLNAYRFSIEWARIEPEPGYFSSAALDHYARVIAACHDHGLAPVVTFHHFSQPRWMARLGGLTTREFVGRFADYCGHAARALDGIAVACTINELNLPMLAADYFNARASTEHRRAAEKALGAPLESFFLFAGAEAVLGNGLAAHAAARDTIRAARSGLPIGMTVAFSEETCDPGMEAQRDRRRETRYAPFLDAGAKDDFVGVQAYSRNHVRADGGSGPRPGSSATTMGWEDRPEAIGEVCRWVASRWNLPMIITENGYPGEDDRRRARFIATALDGVYAAIAAGANIRGYIYWSLLDNFEWMLGYRQRFGLVEIEPGGFKRSPKRSAEILKQAARAGIRPQPA